MRLGVSAGAGMSVGARSEVYMSFEHSTAQWRTEEASAHLFQVLSAYYGCVPDCQAQMQTGRVLDDAKLVPAAHEHSPSSVADET